MSSEIGVVIHPSALRQIHLKFFSFPAAPTRVLGPEGRAVLGHAQLGRSEEHTSELQSRFDLVCRLLLEKKKKLTMDQIPKFIDHHTGRKELEEMERVDEI